jgi:putative protease|tara:strand:+ start:2376 stop:2630 length:255 start_codon:yes stop_codon:yes gene_type:complete
MAKEKKIGKIFSYYSNIGVAAIELTEGSLKVGDEIHIKGSTTDITQKVDSMQVEHEEVKSAKKGGSIGIKVKDRVRPNDEVFKV